ncbi:DUF4189 domain-containing protein [Nocardia anaemiae]|uniref:DUF4189 domain-containing protein n=1 Tax=Nocardia anaemiae TaxID=263910 RepID=UPI0007A557DB|nr:DUF4189 domain-containing protein [Nocardia anaemiae]
MSLLRKLALAMVVPASGALVVAGAGTAHAAGNLYGAIAIWGYRVGVATDYPTQAAADEAAIKSCAGRGDTLEPWMSVACTIKARIHNECGAVIERDMRSLWGSAPLYYVGTGATAAEAEQSARWAAGPDQLGNPLLMVSGSSIPQAAFVLDTVCTSNAG